MNKAKAVFLSTLMGFSLWVSCGRDNVTGTGSDTETAMVVGKILNENGDPVAGAKVRMIPVDYNPQQTAKRLAKAGRLSKVELAAAILADFDTATTNDSGQFAIDSMAGGTYNVFADSGSGQAAYQDSVTIAENAQTVVDPDTLKAPGSLTGVVRLQPGHDARTVFVFALGTSSITTPQDTSGSFTLADMAEGQYSFRILSTLDDYRVVDTSFNVQAGITDTLSDTIYLPYTGPVVAVPTGLDAQALSDTSIFIVWNTVRNATIYEIYRAQEAFGNYASVGTTPGTVFVDTSLEANTQYFYKIKAYADTLASVFSNIAAGTTPPAAPTNVTVTVLSNMTLRVEWNSVSGADSFKVYRAIGSSNVYDSIAITVDTSLVDTQLNTGVTYCYRVKASTPNGDSPFSGADSGRVYEYIFFHSNPFFAVAGAADHLSKLYDSSGSALGLRIGDTIRISAQSQGEHTYARYLTITNSEESSGAWQDTIAYSSGSTFGHFVTEINALVQAVSSGGATATLTLWGTVNISSVGGNDLLFFQVALNEKGDPSKLEEAFSFPDTLQGGSGSHYSAPLRRPIADYDELEDAFDSAGRRIGFDPVFGSTVGLENACEIVGNVNLEDELSFHLTYNSGGVSGPNTTFHHLLEAFSSLGNVSAQIDTISSNIIPDGSVLIGGVGLSAVTVEANDPNTTNNTTPEYFNANMNFIQAR